MFFLFFLLHSLDPNQESSQHPICHGLPLPLLCLHAADDPIIHVDTMPCRIGIAKAIDNMVNYYYHFYCLI